MPAFSCILSKFYIKPQPTSIYNKNDDGCILSKFYIKPQLMGYAHDYIAVVSYRNSTSNHNSEPHYQRRHAVVSYRNSTSNHNLRLPMLNGAVVVSYRNSTSNHNDEARLVNAAKVVSYRNSTSNHNAMRNMSSGVMLYLIEILHQTTTVAIEPRSLMCCILSKFYIKPQQRRRKH